MPRPLRYRGRRRSDARLRPEPRDGAARERVMDEKDAEMGHEWFRRWSTRPRALSLRRGRGPAGVAAPRTCPRGPALVRPPRGPSLGGLARGRLGRDLKGAAVGAGVSR